MSFGGSHNSINHQTDQERRLMMSGSQFSQQYNSIQSQDEIDGYLKEALKKEISLRFMLGIYKLHALQIKSEATQQESHEWPLSKEHSFEKLKNQPTAASGNTYNQVEAKRGIFRTGISPVKNNLQAASFAVDPVNNDRLQSIDQREASLVEKMRNLKFADVRVRDQSSQTVVKGEEFYEGIVASHSRLRGNGNMNNDDIEEQRRLAEIERKEEEIRIIENNLKSKMRVSEETYNELKNQEAELDLRLKELKFEPLSLLGSQALMQNRLASLKQDLYDNFRTYTLNLPPLSSRVAAENEMFFSLFTEAQWEESGEFLHRKSELLKNLEIHLLEERFKMEIVENYLKKEYELIKHQKQELSEVSERYSMMQDYDLTLQRETNLLAEKKAHLEKQRSVFIAEQNIYAKYFTHELHQIANSSPNKLQAVRSVLKDISDLNELTEKQDITFRDAEPMSNPDHENQRILRDLEDENHFLREELEEMKKRGGNDEDYGASMSVQQHNNMQSTRGYNSNQSEIHHLIRESREKRLIIKYLELWLGLSLRRSKGQPINLKTMCMYLWRLKQYNQSHFKRIEDIDLAVDQEGQNYLDRKWHEQASALTKAGRYPHKNLSKKRKEYESALLDYERKRFYQNRLSVLLNAILLRNRRTERLNLVLSFHKFARNCFRAGCRIERSPGLRQPYLSHNGGVDVHGNEIYETNEAGIVGRGIFNQALKWDKPIQSAAVVARSKSPMVGGNGAAGLKGKSMAMKQMTPKQIEEQLAKEMNVVLAKKVRKQNAICLIFLLTMKKEAKETHAVSRAFGTWRHANLVTERTLVTRELNYVHFQLKERMFNDNIFRTKAKLQKSEIDSKLSLLNELLSTVHHSAVN